MLREFREFALKGSMLDMAVGIIIGAAFGTVVKSLVSDVMMPPIGLLLGKVDFAGLYINLSGQIFGSLGEAREAGAAVIAYGAFINNLVTFIFVALAVSLLVKAVNRLRPTALLRSADGSDESVIADDGHPAAVPAAEDDE